MGKNKEQIKSKDWLGHIEWVAMMITLIGGFYLIDGKIERQSCRTDRLYEMFIELVKKDK